MMKPSKAGYPELSRLLVSQRFIKDMSKKPCPFLHNKSLCIKVDNTSRLEY